MFLAIHVMSIMRCANSLRLDWRFLVDGDTTYLLKMYEREGGREGERERETERERGGHVDRDR